MALLPFEWQARQKIDRERQNAAISVPGEREPADRHASPVEECFAQHALCDTVANWLSFIAGKAQMTDPRQIVLQAPAALIAWPRCSAREVAGGAREPQERQSFQIGGGFSFGGTNSQGMSYGQGADRGAR
jgi:hypothetical protein